ncbi:type II secretion system F family protein [Deefgea sp. CFH1-16]|uniref:type II secretion system F family protein n=1 Tax=Deefgea sp. CFH1-16 TaxID=2675457 RepID=UPI0015F48DEB|nr:type II secretion system F family protein [Deefgea sp. CFH1-16]MBM5573544.1 hypothetical protein [Deefgea sp. CFH1-16]
MSIFIYTAIDTLGSTRKGELNAIDKNTAIATLLQQGLSITSLQEQGNKKEGLNKKIGVAERIQFLSSWVGMLNAGIPMGEALYTLADTWDGTALGQILQQKILPGLRSGETVSKMLALPELNFPIYIRHLAKAGEESGVLGSALQSGIDQWQKEIRARKDAITALIYPIILVVTGILAIVTIFLFVVPRFATILKNGHVDLPIISKLVIGSGIYFRSHLIEIGVGLVFLAIAGVFVYRKIASQYDWVSFFWNFPLISTWLVERQSSQWSGMLGMLLLNRVNIISAIDLTIEACEVAVVGNRLRLVAKDLRAGVRFSETIKMHHLLDRIDLNMLTVGEKTGRVAEMLIQISTAHDTKAADAQKRFISLLEPMAILIIGGVVGFMMVAIMLAITSISNIKI